MLNLSSPDTHFLVKRLSVKIADTLVTLHVLSDMFETSLSACDIPWLKICHHVALQGSLWEHMYLAEAVVALIREQSYQHEDVRIKE